METVYEKIKAMSPRSLKAYISDTGNTPTSPHLFYAIKSTIEFCEEFGLSHQTYEELTAAANTFRFTILPHTLVDLGFRYPVDTAPPQPASQTLIIEPVNASRQIIEPRQPCGGCGGGDVL